MIVLLLGKAGAGKTTIAKAMEKYVKDSFVIDGDELRKEMGNFSLGTKGRLANINLGMTRARRLSDLGFTVFVSMQNPYKEYRERFLNEDDIQILVENKGRNPKDEKGYNRDFNPDYSGVDGYQVLQEFNEKTFYETFFKRVLVPARFQGFHKGHKVVLEEAKRISPNVTIAMRVDDGDTIDLDKNIKLLENRGYKVIKSPNIKEDWTDWANQYDVYVQGNPMVIEKFKNSTCKLKLVPRYGDVSGTNIRKDLEGSAHQIDKDVREVLKDALNL